jgi:hypothetical protein
LNANVDQISYCSERVFDALREDGRYPSVIPG